MIPLIGVGCPIRRSRDQRVRASPPGFSQRATSFIASQCQGIHQMPLISLHASSRRPRGIPPRDHDPREDTLLDHARPPYSRAAACPLVTSRLSSLGKQHNSGLRREPGMEVTGFEPAPSCLQSRRSPG